MEDRLLSIVTVCFNSEKTIIRTIESVLNQTFTNYEYIFIDGLSSDKTNEIINSYKEKFISKGIPVIHISEKDNGIYDAMNKAAKLASGKWINYMNSDDYFYNDNILESIFNDINNYNYDVIYGDTCFIKENRKYIERGKDINTIIKHIPFCPQSTFVKTSLQKKYNFNCKYKISADYDFFLRLYLDQRKYVYINKTIANFSFGGASNCNLINTYNEDVEVKHSNGILNKNSILSKVKYYVFNFKYKIIK